MQLFRLCLVTLLLGMVQRTTAEVADQVTEQFKTANFFAAPDSSDYRKYAPDRIVKISNLAIDVTPDFTNRTIAARATITFKPIAEELTELSFDAVDLRVSTLKSSEPLLDYQVADDKIVVTFAKPVPVAKEVSITVEYTAQPEKGIYFRTPEMGYKPGDTHLFSQGEAIEARHWYPCLDAPNQKLSSEVTCRVPEGMTVISNGRKISETKDPATGLVAVKWRQEKPHANYLVTLCAGYFAKIEDRYRDIPMAFYTPQSDINEAQNSFRDTKDMMAFFEKEIGVPYPWDKYDQVVVNDFVAGGMENTSATTLTDRTLFQEATENLRDSEGLVAHELAHQWFGDYVTCKDWSHLWLNEGFATYYAHLYTAHKNGREELLYDLYNNARGILPRLAENPRPIMDRKYDSPDAMFGFLAYDKGSWVLHMLRSQLGEEMYRRCVQTYLERQGLNNVVTEDLNRVIEELSGKSFDQFFDQWVYHGGAPELEVSYAWDARTKLARISVRQNQKLSDDVALFNLPLPVRFKTKAGVIDKTITVKEKAEDFYFALPEAPIGVRVDPELTLLARIRFDVAAPLLETQRQDAQDMLGRLLAVETLSKRQDNDSVQKLKQMLNGDAFYGVRIEAARALRTIHSDEARTALLASMKQTNARVRRQVLESLGSFYHEEVFAAQLAVLGEEKNPGVKAEAIEALGAYPKPELREALLKQLESDSYRNELSSAAIRAMRTANDASFVVPLQNHLKTKATAYEGRSFSTGLNALATLAQDLTPEQKTPVREFLLGYLDSPRRSVRVGVLNALGILADPRAIGVLEKYTLATKNGREQTAATEALRKITASRDNNNTGLADLRNLVLDLQKDNAGLRKDLKAMEKKFDAFAPAGETGKKPATPVKSPREKSK